MNKYQHVILDLDGTLIEEAPVLVAQADVVADTFGDSPEAKRAIIQAFFGANDRAVREGGELKNDLAQYMIWMGETLGVQVTEAKAKELAEAWSKVYETFSQTPTLFPDTTTFLDGLRERGYTPLLASGGREDEKRARLAAVGIEHYFGRVFAAGDIGFQKQDVRFWEVVLAELNVEPSTVLVIGNQINDDVWRPSELGMATTLLQRAGALDKQSDPQDIVPDQVVTELTTVLNSL